MSIIAQKSLFEWSDIEQLGDLDRLALVLATIPDEALMKALEKQRGSGRDDYPIRAMWNSYLTTYPGNSGGAQCQHLQPVSREADERALPEQGEAAVSDPGKKLVSGEP